MVSFTETEQLELLAQHNKQYHRNTDQLSFPLNGHTLGLAHPQTQTLNHTVTVKACSIAFI